jgi:hypothetical protein
VNTRSEQMCRMSMPEIVQPDTIKPVLHSENLEACVSERG